MSPCRGLSWKKTDKYKESNNNKNSKPKHLQKKVENALKMFFTIQSSYFNIFFPTTKENSTKGLRDLHLPQRNSPEDTD
ncbi:hypothetical protein EXN66_Car001095 [Channa argus]|uniref:Uncharacterized protein n=1 Tax=Channa argus TaxID=215402 RepID=A0A6G1QZ50_CHAAH|nr:hypothetical protein EXN66_Car001095 [Channa argus]